MSKTSNNEMSTSIPERHFIFKWVVHDFSKTPGILDSGFFSTNSEFPKDWYFNFVCITEDSACLLLWHLNQQDKPVQVFLDLSVYDANGTLILNRLQPHEFKGENEKANLCELKLDRALPTDILHIRCKMTVYGFAPIPDTSIREEEPSADLDINDLKRDLLNMLYLGAGADIEIVCPTGSFRVHECILNQRAPSFTSKHSSEIKMSKVQLDFDLAVVKMFFEYVYSGDVHGLDSVLDVKALHLLSLVYGFPRLQDICVNALIKGINLNNVCEILNFADSSHEEEIVLCCIAFGQLHFQELKETAQWIKLINLKPHLESFFNVEATIIRE